MPETKQHTSLLPPPSKWFLYWGITVLFLGFLVFIGLAWLINYPEIYEAPAIITTSQPPLQIISPGSGELEEVLVEDKTLVQREALLFVLDNPANLKDVIALEGWIASTQEQMEGGQWRKMEPVDGLKLGAIQPAYAIVYKEIKDFKRFLSKSVTAAQIKLLEDQVGQIESLNKAMGDQVQVLRRIADLALKDLARHQNDKIFSKFEQEQAEINYLQYQRQYEELESQRINNKIRASEIKFQILELRETLENQIGDRRTTLQQALLNLDAALEDWKKECCLKAPKDGVVEFSKPWQKNAFVAENERLGFIIPQKDTLRVFARALLGVKGAGKVKPGMIARIRLDNFPYREFGVLRGKVFEINTLAGEEGTYEITIALPKELITSHGHQIDYRPEMTGLARIVTEKKRFLERLFEQLLSVIEEN